MDNPARQEAYAAGKHFYEAETGLLYFFQGADKPYHVAGPLSFVQRKRPSETARSWFTRMTREPNPTFPALECVGLPD